jgi:hypothetical protein
MLKNILLKHNYVEKNIAQTNELDYSKIDTLAKFEGEHPEVMKERISKQNWTFDFDPTQGIKLSSRLRFLNYLEKATGLEIGRHKNYKKI